MEYLRRLWSKSPSNIIAARNPTNLQNEIHAKKKFSSPRRGLKLGSDSSRSFLSSPSVKNYDEYLIFSSEWYLNMNPTLLYRSGTRSGKVIFSLRDIPIGITFFTERGTPIVRIDEKYILLGTTVIPIPNPLQVANESNEQQGTSETITSEDVNQQGMITNMRKEIEEERHTILVEKMKVEEEWENLKQEKLALQEERECAIRLAKEKKKEQEVLEKVLEETELLEKKKLKEDKLRKSQEWDRENMENLLLMERGKKKDTKWSEKEERNNVTIQDEEKSEWRKSKENESSEEQRTPSKQKTEKEILEREERVRQKGLVNWTTPEKEQEATEKIEQEKEKEKEEREKEKQRIEREKYLEKKRQSTEWRKAVMLPPSLFNNNPEIKSFDIRESIPVYKTATPKNESPSYSTPSNNNTSPPPMTTKFSPPSKSQKLRHLSMFRAKIPKEKRKKPTKKPETTNETKTLKPQEPLTPNLNLNPTYNNSNNNKTQTQITPNQSQVTTTSNELRSDSFSEIQLNEQTTPHHDTNNDNNETKQSLKERIVKIGGVGMPLFDPSSVKLKSKTRSLPKENLINTINSSDPSTPTNTLILPKLRQAAKENKESKENKDNSETGIKQLDFRGLLKKSSSSVGEPNQ